ncbi:MULTISPECIES: hybrid sensor histidine kinase/response regulator [unclassified Brevundimonas]|uniref:hybrid sensor histidine kinase/response regulator n=1 Tax=unclassified Brevundimonas TaxID=2622653 RepID=UPI0025C008B5|nr:MULTISPECIES: PAS domain-containing sensor histidine kinase [unclassified Brevundimonas]
MKDSLDSEDRRYRLLVDAITDYAVYMLDENGYVSSWNPGAQRFKGYRADEIVGQHFSRFYTPEDRASDLPKRALAEAAEQGRFEHEGWRLRQDGTRFWAHVVIDPIRDPAGKVIGFAKVTRDLTERRAAEEQLRLSQEQFQLLVNGVTDYAIYMLDPSGLVSSWNSGAERIKGFRRDEIVGEHFSRFYTAEDREAGLPERALETATADGRFEKEGWRLRKDGSRFWAHVIIDAVRNDDGAIIGFAKVTRDITERMESQRQLEAAREALFQSQKLEAIGQLTGGIAHDFNNLLSAVLGSLDLVRKRLPFDPRISPLIDNAILGAERGAALTQRMLAFARKQDLETRPTDLPALVGGMRDFLQRTIGPRIEIETEFPRGLAPILTDPVQLETTLLNLAVNARDAMPDAGVIRIGASAAKVKAGDPLLAPGDYVKLYVSDTGEGMDPATLARAADPFFTTKGVGKGTGLGLSMIHGLMAQTGGRLQIDSQPGEGTTVTLWLRVAEGAEGLSAIPTVDPVQAGKALLRILAVDDDPRVLINTTALLEDLGHEVITASSGKQALVHLKSDVPLDLMVTDHVMPQMSGFELILEAKRLRPGLPALITSGFAELDTVDNDELLRLPKPFNQADLERAVWSAVEGDIQS